MMPTELSAVLPARHIQEECGVFGLFSPETADVASLAYYGLFALQHRGQESAGIAVNDDGVFSVWRGVGLAGEALPRQRLQSLGAGQIAVGHVRYATTGSDAALNAQPLMINHFKGRMALAHNGNLTNSMELRRMLEEQGSIFHTTTDSEVIAYLLVRERLRTPSIEAAVRSAMNDLEGAYSLVIASPTKLIAVRDPHGFRPLCMGRRPDGSVVFASESCALDAVGAVLERDIRPGEIVTVGRDGVHSDASHCDTVPRRLCVFEFIYFARPDSVIDGSSVHVARQRAGAFLAPFLYGLYWKKATSAACWASFLFSTVVMLSNIFVGSRFPALLQSPINAGAFCMLAGLVIVPVVSLFTRKPDPVLVEDAFSCYNKPVIVAQREALGD